MVQIKNVKDSSNAPRGIEIEWWLNNHGYSRFSKNNVIQKYVILDDDTDMLFNHRNNFCTNFK